MLIFDGSSSSVCLCVSTLKVAENLIPLSQIVIWNHGGTSLNILTKFMPEAAHLSAEKKIASGSISSEFR